jgi:hypothetical protein
MVMPSIRTIRLGIVFVLAVFLVGCSSGDDGGDAPAAAANSVGGGEEGATGGYKLTQAFNMGIEVTSPVFSRIRRIPKQHTCPGITTKAGQSFATNYEEGVTFENTSPPLEWTGVPDGTVSIALVMDSDQIAEVRDTTPGQAAESAPDNAWSHWVIWNIPADSTGLAEAVASTTEVLAIGPNTRQGVNDDKTVGYSGPCPVPVTVERSGYFGTPKIVFSYFFHIYALDVELDLGPETTKSQLLEAIDGHILAGGEIKGEFLAKKNLVAY